jgi:hypothetical protein
MFHNRRGDRLQILAWQGDGFAPYLRRLERGTFAFPSADSAEEAITATDLSMTFGGIELGSAKWRPRTSCVYYVLLSALAFQLSEDDGHRRRRLSASGPPMGTRSFEGSFGWVVHLSLRRNSGRMVHQVCSVTGRLQYS